MLFSDIRVMNSSNIFAECGSEVTTSNFCTNCQKNVEFVRKNLICTECGAKIPQDSNTCADCGNSFKSLSDDDI